MDGINDPAWFYSSLAQTTAAIVGLIGAVLGSRIIEHIGFVRAERRTVDAAVAQAFQQLHGIIENLKTLPSWLAQEIAVDEEALCQGLGKRTLHGDRQLDGGGWSGSGRTCDPGERKDLLAKRRQLAQQLTQVYLPLAGAVDDAAVQKYAQRLIDAQPTIDRGLVPEADNVANQLRGNADMLLRLLTTMAAFRRNLLPASFRFIFVVLIWLTATGVIWPLAVLPGLPGSEHKILMLGALAIGLVGLIGFFGYQFVELWRLGRFHWHP